MRTSCSLTIWGGGGLDLIPLNFPLGCVHGSDPPQFPPWVWVWIWSPPISILGVGLDLIPLNFPLGCGPGPDPPQFPPWVWAWRGVSLRGLLGRGVSFWGVSLAEGEGSLLGRGVAIFQHALRQTPPVDRITDTSKNITLATTSLRPVIISNICLKLLEFSSISCDFPYYSLSFPVCSKFLGCSFSFFQVFQYEREPCYFLLKKKKISDWSQSRNINLKTYSVILWKVTSDNWQ